jgi:hypothetical protein
MKSDPYLVRGGSGWFKVAQIGMWWLRLGCGGSDWNVVAQIGMWWLRLGCGGSDWDVMALYWDVVTQLANEPIIYSKGQYESSKTK